MSAVNYINENNLPTNHAIDEYFKSASLDYIKSVRFDNGCKPSVESMRHALRLRRIVCSDYCYISDEQDKAIREEVINHSILKLNEL